MKTSEQMTRDVLKRRDEQLKARSRTRAGIIKIGVPCTAALALIAVCAADTHNRGRYVHSLIGKTDNINTSSAEIGSPNIAVSNANSAHIIGSGELQTYLPSTNEKRDFTNPNVGKNDIHILEVGTFNTDNGVKGDPNDLDECSMEQLYNYYGIEFDRLTKLHPDWKVQHEPLGVYKKYSDDGFAVSMSMYCTLNTLNYTTESGAKISVSAQYGKFSPLSTEMFAADKPFRINYETSTIVDENGNTFGVASYDPAKDTTPRPTNDEGISMVNDYDAYIYRDSSGSFAADIIMNIRVRITAEGLSEAEFLAVLDEYTGNTTSAAATSQDPDNTSKDYPQISNEDLANAIGGYPIDEITLPDGSTISKYDAISAQGEALPSNRPLVFEFAFYRTASPICKTTDDDPNLIKYSNGAWRSTVDTAALEKEIDLSYKKVVKGDVLENGLTVSSADCTIDSSGEITGSELRFEGEITLTGALSYSPDEGMTMHLRPDTTKADVPALYSSTNMVFQFFDNYKNGEDDPPFYMYFDGFAWDLGSKNSAGYGKLDLDSVFGGKTTIIATVTLTDISFSQTTGITATIVDIK